MLFEKASVAALGEINGSGTAPHANPFDAHLQRRNIRILIADDHTVVREALSARLKLNSDIEVAGEAADGDEAVQKARRLQPDVVLMDINMPKMNGIEATRIIHFEFPEIRIIGLSMYDKNELAAQMIEAGASTYCMKGGDTHNLLSAIRGEAEVNGCEVSRKMSTKTPAVSNLLFP